jgi:hypothetical protein
MPQVDEKIPRTLQPRVDAAVAWFNQTDKAAGTEFKVTGILDAKDALSGSEELRLILCGGDRCEQHSFRVSGTVELYEVAFSTDFTLPDGEPQAELDPPPGPRLQWLDDKLSQHAFIVLLFYRGFW